MSDCCSRPPEKLDTPQKPTNCCSASAGSHVHHSMADNAAVCVNTTTKMSSCCEGEKAARFDYLLWGSLFFCAVLYALHFLQLDELPLSLSHLSHAVFEMLNSMWWGVLMGLFFVGILANIPQNLVLSLLGKGGTLNGIFRATAAGVLLDLCSHGILMVGAQLYKKGASLGQVMAFLIASPWNSFSLTLIMFSLIGVKWTLAFIILSMFIAIVSGWIFDKCVARNILPSNPNGFELDADFKFWPEAKKQWSSICWSLAVVKNIVREGASGSRMVLRWLLFGVLLAAAIRAFVSVDVFQQWFGPSLVGIVLTLLAATVIEVCSEGSAPIAADLLNRAGAPGNAFTFMMAGVSTDYTEVIVLKEVTQSWKIALFLPLITLPQILVVGYLLNQ